MHHLDYAAGGPILAEAGGHSETLEGEPIHFASLPLQPRSAVAAAETLLFGEWKTWLHEHA
jgi:myo-inositol-1(or 4)-monophosphatase